MNPWLSDYKSLQGNVGLVAAIAYYTSSRWFRSSPNGKIL